MVRALIAATLLLLLSAQPAFAIGWDGEAKLSSAETLRPELVRTGASAALAAWVTGSSFVARRTTDGGTTWLPAQTLSTSLSLGASVAASGQNVNAVFAKRVRCPASGAFVSRIYHRRSVDGGGTWGAPVALTSSCSEAIQPDVARSSDGQVSVVWTGLTTGRILIRTSRDGGVTFAPAIAFASTTIVISDTSAPAATYSADPQVAIGSSGTTYAAYASAPDTLSIRRSRDRGTTWSAPTRLTADAIAPNMSLVATGTRAIVGYTVDAGSLFRGVYRTTADRGATWSAAKSVVSVPSGQFSTDPIFAYQAGVLAVIFKFGPPGSSPVSFRESADFGATWSARTRVSVAHSSPTDPGPGGIAILDTRTLAGYNENGDVTGLWVRRGEP